MISPHTPPGTLIVCIDAKCHSRYCIRPFLVLDDGLGGLREQRVYTVRDIKPDDRSTDGFAVRLVEIVRIAPDTGFALSRFKPAVLPKAITSLLEAAPVKEPA